MAGLTDTLRTKLIPQNAADLKNRLNISTRKWDKELQAYRDARAQGIQPDGTSMKKIEQAVKISNETGKAYGV